MKGHPLLEPSQITTAAATHVVDSGHILFLHPFGRLFDIEG